MRRRMLESSRTTSTLLTVVFTVMMILHAEHEMSRTRSSSGSTLGVAEAACPVLEVIHFLRSPVSPNCSLAFPPFLEGEGTPRMFVYADVTTGAGGSLIQLLDERQRPFAIRGLNPAADLWSPDSTSTVEKNAILPFLDPNQEANFFSLGVKRSFTSIDKYAYLWVNGHLHYAKFEHRRSSTGEGYYALGVSTAVVDFPMLAEDPQLEVYNRNSTVFTPLRKRAAPNAFAMFEPVQGCLSLFDTKLVHFGCGNVAGVGKSLTTDFEVLVRDGRFTKISLDYVPLLSSDFGHLAPEGSVAPQRLYDDLRSSNEGGKSSAFGGNWILATTTTTPHPTTYLFNKTDPCHFWTRVLDEFSFEEEEIFIGCDTFYGKGASVENKTTIIAVDLISILPPYDFKLIVMLSDLSVIVFDPAKCTSSSAAGITLVSVPPIELGWTVAPLPPTTAAPPTMASSTSTAAISTTTTATVATMIDGKDGSQNDESSSGSNSGRTVLVAVGLGALVIVIVISTTLAVSCLIKRRRRKKSSSRGAEGNSEGKRSQAGDHQRSAQEDFSSLDQSHPEKELDRVVSTFQYAPPNGAHHDHQRSAESPEGWRSPQNFTLPQEPHRSDGTAQSTTGPRGEQTATEDDDGQVLASIPSSGNTPGSNNSSSVPLTLRTEFEQKLQELSSENHHEDVRFKKTLATINLLREGKFTILEKVVLGKGSFGKVNKCLLSTGEAIAVKRIALDPSLDRGLYASDDSSKERAEMNFKQVVKEIEILFSIQHPAVLQIYHCEFRRDTLEALIFMELASGGSLGALARNMSTQIPEEAVVNYIRQVAGALAALHECSIAHRDLKGDNILRTNDGQIKLGDFGAAKLTSKHVDGQSTAVHTGLKTVIGTAYFIAPEVLVSRGATRPVQFDDLEFSFDEDQEEMEEAGRDGENEKKRKKKKSTQGFYDAKVDIWSLGIVICELLDRGRMPWPKFPTRAHAFMHIAKPGSLPIIPKHVSDECRDFISRCCQRDPQARPSAKQLLCHPWLAAKSGSDVEKKLA